MKITVEAKELKSALSRVKATVATVRDIPVLNCVLLKPSRDKVSLTTFNFNTGTVTKLDCQVESLADEISAIPFATFSSIIGLISGEVTLDITKEKIIITHSSGKFELSLPDPEEYPQLPEFKAGGVSLDWVEVSKALSVVRATASKEVSKQILTGVCCTNVNGCTELAATDSHRLLVKTLDAKLSDTQLVIGGSIIDAALSAFSSCGDRVEFAYQDNLVEFSNSQTKVTGFTIQGDYPKYTQLIPSKFLHDIEIKTKDFAEALKLMQPFNISGTGLVTLTKADQKIKLESTAKDLGNCQTEVSCNSESEQELLISFRLDFLLLAINQIKDEYFQLRMNGYNQPAVINAVDYLHLIMPVQIR